MTTRTTIAQWMLDRFHSRQYLDQEEAAAYIEHTFGAEWVHHTASGGLGIDQKVLREFRRLHGGRAEYDPSEKAWFHA